MPELPEVETVKNGLVDLISNQVSEIIIRFPRLRYPLNQAELNQAVGQSITALSRRAKYLIIHLEHGALIIHLGMSGRVTLYKQPPPPVLKHDHVDILCGAMTLRYNDPRRFGCIIYSENYLELDFIRSLGPEPLEDDFSAEYLYSKIANRNTPIKQLIMDNAVVVGVGNIYACEALFISRISPLRPGKSITPTECQTLVNIIREVHKEAIAAGGSSINDYKNAHGELGYFQQSHQVYGRAAKECYHCGATILETRIAQRNSFYCPQCQK